MREKNSADIGRVSVIIPAYKPDEKLIKLLGELVSRGFSDIIVVDDGSGEAFAGIFEKVKGFQECTLLTHEVNQGKGRALKTAMSFCAEHRKEAAGVVTADADGQHLTEDIAAVSQEVMTQEKVILGVRDFTKSDIPARSVAGNRITSAVFRLFFGMKLQDTQTGLRGIPMKHLEALLEAEGDRYEYETNQLLMLNKYKIPYEQVEIATVYIDENQTSHFHVVRDSLRIYGLIFKYAFSSSASFLVDALLFYVVKKWCSSPLAFVPLTFWASLVARAVSSVVNYVMNAKLVFRGEVNRITFIKYYILVVVQILLSALCVFVLEKTFGVLSPALSTVLKILVDTVLFFFSFRIQHKWVFDREK